MSGSGPWTLTTIRAVNGTTEAAHGIGSIVFKVVGPNLIQVTNRVALPRLRSVTRSRSTTST